MSVLRYVQRTGEPLVVADATDDDRFARDPYFADLDCCSLLAVPILSRGSAARGAAAGEPLIRGAFTAERSTRVKLIAGQLAVSLDNAQMYADIPPDRRRADRLAAGSDNRRARRAAVHGARSGGPGGRTIALGRPRRDRPVRKRAFRYRDRRLAHDGRAVPLGTDVRLGGQNVMSMVFSSGGPVRIEAYSQLPAKSPGGPRPPASDLRSGCRSQSRDAYGA